MKILVTGANGYLGRGIVRELITNGHNVIATDFKLEYVDEKAIKYESDIFKIQNAYVNLGQPDVLLHLAWRNGFIHDSETHIQDLGKHYEFIKNMVNGGVKKVAVMGSMHEVGFYEGSINENTPCNPMNLYGISKNSIRDIVEILVRDNNVLFQWLRGYYIVGNDKDGNSIFSKIIEAEEEGKKEFPFTMGQNQYDFLDYEDFCKYVAAAVGQNEINGIINISSGKPEKLADRVEKFIKDNKYKIHLRYGAFPDRPYDSKAIWGDSKKIEEILKRKKYMCV